MRGGTSKCWLFDDEALAGADADTLLAAAFGAGDPRQLDGVGGATSTTSKAAIVRRSDRPGVDVDYDFAQVGIGARRVEWGSNCGNCATAIGLYALLTGLVPAQPGRTTVRLRNTNTGTLLAATVATPDGTVPESGDVLVPGAAVGGVGVELAFLDPAGGTTGSLLPTGRAVDRFPLPATLIDAGAPAALFPVSAFGNAPFEDLVPELIRLRREAALRMGLATPDGPVDHAVPKTGVVGPPVDYRTADGVPVAAGEYDVAVRMLSMLAPHPAVGLTSAVALAAAATVPGSVVSPYHQGNVLRLGTPAGVVTVGIDRGPGGALAAVRMRRAARRIAVAEISVPEPALAPA
ncbi:methylitaconate delta2-delta3-isomerase [Amycolatopsis bartoniae]|uniref:Methylitaconate delta2-delta3-isomerase n=2 Tax=Amycolatopsis bartoniae TaxID=941986 RepID=A0A8H9IR72_9PSEU|nr:methylitaconate delta2-delta3-isomerase [Amycolatopsis bartoniae]